MAGSRQTVRQGLVGLAAPPTYLPDGNRARGQRLDGIGGAPRHRGHRGGGLAIPLRGCVGALLLQAWLVAALAAEAPVLALREDWSGYFGGTETTFHVTVQASAAEPAYRIGWELVVDQRASARGEQAVTATPTAPGLCEIRLSLPPVKAGVVVAATLHIAAIPAKAGMTSPPITRTLWLFPADPFADQQARLREQRLRLFDPRGDTRAVLAAAGLPCEPVRSPDALAEQPPCTLIVGAGVALTEHRGLFAALTRLAAQGHRILWLTPAGGAAPLPGTDATDGLPAPSRLTFCGPEIITALDKRLDAGSWPPGGDIVGARIGLKADRSRVLAEFGPGANGWPWLAVEYGNRGRLLVCGFAIIERWEAGPVPRFLLARLLEGLLENKE